MKMRKYGQRPVDEFIAVFKNWSLHEWKIEGRLRKIGLFFARGMLNG